MSVAFERVSAAFHVSRKVKELFAISPPNKVVLHQGGGHQQNHQMGSAGVGSRSLGSGEGRQRGFGAKATPPGQWAQSQLWGLTSILPRHGRQRIMQV